MNGRSTAAQTSRPRVLAGFEHVKRYWDRRRHAFVAKILPGEYYVSRDGEMITTVLGSCVSVCIRDPVSRVGGMNHFMLPHSTQWDLDHWARTTVNSAARYGSFAMEHLINTVLKAGGYRERLEIKLFGGGQVLNMATDIGARNVEFAQQYLAQEGFEAIAQDISGPYPRKVNYYPDTGKAFIKKLCTMHNNAVAKRETEYLREIGTKPVAGEIDLF